MPHRIFIVSIIGIQLLILMMTILSLAVGWGMDPRMFQAVSTTAGMAIASVVVALWRETHKVKGNVLTNTTAAADAKTQAEVVGTKIEALEQALKDVPSSNGMIEDHNRLAKRIDELSAQLQQALRERDEYVRQQRMCADVIEAQRKEIDHLLEEVNRLEKEVQELRNKG